MSNLDPDFLQFPLERLADAALSKARDLGCTHADFRFERLRSQSLSAKDRSLQGFQNSETVGFSVRAIHDGGWGFASDFALTAEAAVDAASRAVDVAKRFGSLNSEPVELAEEPAYTDTYVSPYEINPFDVDDQDKINFLIDLNDVALSTGKIDHADSYLIQVQENKFLASLSGTRVTQQRIRLTADLSAVKINQDTGVFESMGTASPPSGKGWEFIGNDYDYKAAAEQLPSLLEEKIAAPSVEPGFYDLVIHPSNLWLVIHESVAHSTELDRVLGYEATLAGTSFATLDNLNKLQFGSNVMNVTGDRVDPFGLGTIGYDDEGVKAQTWDIIRDGKLVGYQLNRQMALKLGLDRSNGCAYADAPSSVPLQRMPNITLQPSPEDISLNDLIGGVERGIYILGNGSWSIDQQRYNFQFGGQQFWEIRGGKLAGQLKDVAYQGNTTDFWNAMEVVGGKDTYILYGTFNCGKGLPGQAAPAGHGAPAGLFRNIKVLNSVQEGSR